jgi:hypothetical protein
MRNRPGPKKKSGERYPSGDLKPVLPPALWGRLSRDGGSAFGRPWNTNAQLIRLSLHGELSDAQTEAGMGIAQVYRHVHSTAEVHASAEQEIVAFAQAAWLALDGPDGLLSDYSRAIREAVLELCVHDHAVNSRLYPEIRQVLDRAALIVMWRPEKQTLARRQPRRPRLLFSYAEELEVNARIEDLANRDKERGRYENADAVAIKSVLCELRPDLSEADLVNLVSFYTALVDREKFRSEKVGR